MNVHEVIELALTLLTNKIHKPSDISQISYKYYSMYSIFKYSFLNHFQHFLTVYEVDDLVILSFKQFIHNIKYAR